MTTTPKRYQFDTPMPSVEPRPLPVRRPDAAPVEPDRWVPAGPYDQPQQVIVQHIHQAQPDRVLQRLALGAGMGAGVVAAGVYFGPMLIAGMWSIAITFGVGGLVVVVIARSVVSLLNPPESKTGRKGRR